MFCLSYFHNSLVWHIFLLLVLFLSLILGLTWSLRGVNKLLLISKQNVFIPKRIFWTRYNHHWNGWVSEWVCARHYLWARLIQRHTSISYRVRVCFSLFLLLPQMANICLFFIYLSWIFNSFMPENKNQLFVILSHSGIWEIWYVCD